MKPLRQLIAVAALATTVATTGLTAQTITSFDDIASWSGTGANRAALVIDWNDGNDPPSFAWGFRWDGVATGQDMFNAIAGNFSSAVNPTVPGPPSATGSGDPALSLYVRIFSFDGGVTFTPSVDRVTYAPPSGPAHDQNSDGFNSGFWSYWTADGSDNYPTEWTEAMFGFSDRTLANGSWDGWSYTPTFTGFAPEAPLAAVPEPGVIALIALGLTTILRTLHRRAA